MLVSQAQQMGTAREIDQEMSSPLVRALQRMSHRFLCMIQCLYGWLPSKVAGVPLNWDELDFYMRI